MSQCTRYFNATENLNKLCVLKSWEYARQMNNEGSSLFEQIISLFKHMALFLLTQ